MEYIKNPNTLKLGFNIESNAKINFTPEGLVDNFIDISQHISEKKITNRMLWPDYEIEGIEIKRDKPKLYGSITPNKITIDTYESLFEKSIKDFETWFGEDIKIPDINEFEVNWVYIVPNREYHSEEYTITLDKTKLKENNFGPIVASEGIEMIYSTPDLTEVLSLYPLKGESISINKAKTVFEYMIDNEIIIKVREENLSY